MSLLLLFNGGTFQSAAPPPAGLIDFTLATAAIDGLGGVPGIADARPATLTARQPHGRTGIGDVAGGIPRHGGGGGTTRIR